MSKQSKTRGINHILNYNRKKNAPQPALANVYYDKNSNGDNVQIACDGYRLAVLKDFAEVDSVVVENSNNNSCVKWETFNWKNVCDIDAFISSGNIVELPDLKALKEYVKALKKLDIKQAYDFGENQPLINVEYLLDAMEIVNLKTATAYAGGYCNTSILLIDTNGNYVYTLGIRPKFDRKKTDLSVRYEVRDGHIHKTTV